MTTETQQIELPCGDLPTLRAVAEHLLLQIRADEAGQRRFTEDDLNPLFAAIDPGLTDAARAIIIRSALLPSASSRRESTR